LSIKSVRSIAYQDHLQEIAFSNDSAKLKPNNGQSTNNSPSGQDLDVRIDVLTPTPTEQQPNNKLSENHP